MGKIKVYQGSTNGRDRVCIGATSWKQAHAHLTAYAPSLSLSYMRKYWSISQNPEQVSLALAQPLIPFRQERDHEPYRQWEKSNVS